jgi:flagellin-like hook-associated protein FlgL
MVGTTNTSFYVGGNTSNNTAALNLATKINAFGQVYSSAVSNHINILSNSTSLTDGGTAADVSTTDDNVRSAASSFGIEIFQATSDRVSYASQFDTIMAQLDKLATDSGYKGINFLGGTSNVLDVEFYSTAGDSIRLTGFDASAATLLAKTSNSSTAENSWATNDDIDADIAGLAAATATLKTKSSEMSSGLSIINTRQDWVTAMVNTITEGADKLTLADMNEEGANMLMLQTRQTLGTTALSLSAQAAQSVLRLFA